MNSVLGWGDEQFTIGGQESVPMGGGGLRKWDRLRGHINK